MLYLKAVDLLLEMTTEDRKEILDFIMAHSSSVDTVISQAVGRSLKIGIGPVIVGSITLS